MPTFPTPPAGESLYRKFPVQPSDVPVGIEVQSLCTWDEAYLFLAHTIAVLRGKDPNRVVGCFVVTDDNRVLSANYNGLRPGQPDSPDFWFGQERQGCIHAEENALENLWKYTAKERRKNLKMYVNHVPCVDMQLYQATGRPGGCTEKIIKSGMFALVGVPKFVVENYRRRGPQKFAEIEVAYAAFKQAGIEVQEVEMTVERAQALAASVLQALQFFTTQKEKPEA